MVSSEQEAGTRLRVLRLRAGGLEVCVPIEAVADLDRLADAVPDSTSDAHLTAALHPGGEMAPATWRVHLVPSRLNLLDDGGRDTDSDRPAGPATLTVVAEDCLGVRDIDLASARPHPLAWRLADGTPAGHLLDLGGEPVLLLRAEALAARSLAEGAGANA